MCCVCITWGVAQGGTIIEAWMPLEDQYQCTQRYCEDYVDDSPLGQVGRCNRSHTTVPNEQPGSLWNGEIVPLTNLTIGGALWYQGPPPRPLPCPAAAARTCLVALLTSWSCASEQCH